MRSFERERKLRLLQWRLALPLIVTPLIIALAILAWSAAGDASGAVDAAVSATDAFTG